MRLRTVAAFTIGWLAAGVAHAQRGPAPRRPVQGDPAWWGSAWGGYQWSGTVNDPATGTTWTYDANWTVGLTAERALDPRSTLGVAWSYARLPVAVTGTGCSAGCVGDGTIAAYGVTYHSGGGLGLHPVYEAFLGAMRFGQFAVTGTGARTLAGVTDTDLAWTLGTGLGYGLARDYALTLVGHYGTSLHERSADRFTRRTTRHFALRAGLRVGL